MLGITEDGSARATAPTTISLEGFARALHHSTWRCQLTPSWRRTSCWLDRVLNTHFLSIRSTAVGNFLFCPSHLLDSYYCQRYLASFLTALKIIFLNLGQLSYGFCYGCVLGTLEDFKQVIFFVIKMLLLMEKHHSDGGLESSWYLLILLNSLILGFAPCIRWLFCLELLLYAK